MQDKIKIDGTDIWQPDEDLKVSFVTTYTEDSTRVQSGAGHFTPMFTVEQVSYSASNIPASEVAAILQKVIGRNFSLHYFDPYSGSWKDAVFYVGKGDCTIGTLKAGEEKYTSLAFNMTGVNPI